MASTSDGYNLWTNALRHNKLQLRNLNAHIDVYTEKGGHGPNAPGGTFATNETVQVYIEVWDELNHTVPYQLVSFEVLIVGVGHYNTYFSTANASGIATITNPINPNVATEYEDIATANYEGIALTDVITITVQRS